MLSVDGSSENSLVEHPANDFALGWAPDGKSVLFASDRNGTLGSWSIQVAEGKPHGDPKLVKPDMGPIVSLGFTEEGSFYYGFHQRLYDIYFAELDPETGETVTPPEKAIRRFEGYNLTPGYSPDGKYLAYISRRPPYTYYGYAGNVLCIKSLETGKEREFRPDLHLFGFPSWSPDGSSVLVLHWSAKGQKGYYRIETQTGSVEPVLLSGENYSLSNDHQWSPSGKTIYYGRMDKEADSRQIIAMDIENGKEKIIYQSDDFFTLSISPDGQWLALCFPRGENPRLNIISTTGGESRELCRFEEGIKLGGTSSKWTADGKYILFGMYNSKTDNEKHELCRIPASGGELEKLGLIMKGGYNYLSTHPNGRHIAFSSSEYAAEIWVMENLLPKTGIK